jgi:hypothetical protein
MDQGPLVRDEADLGAELVRRLDKAIPVKAAFWIKESEVGHWYLYIASDQFDSPGKNVGYGKVLQLAEEIDDPYLDPFRVKLIHTSDPLAQAVLEYLQKYPRKTATRLGGMPFGGTFIDGAHIYPPSVTAGVQ